MIAMPPRRGLRMAPRCGARRRFFRRRPASVPLRGAAALPALLVLACLVLAWAGPALARPRAPLAVSPGELCRQAIAGAERAHGIPDSLLAAIGRVESGRRGADGDWHPWPWTINVAGEGHFYDSEPAAIEAVRAFQAQGVHSIDVGCTQVNLVQHPTAFASLQQAFDPRANADYAARFLAQLHAVTGDWQRAAALYHSATPALGADYQRKVLAVWPEESRHSDEAQRLKIGKLYWAMNHTPEP